MSAALSKAIRRAKELLKEKQKEETALKPVSIQFGGQRIPPLPGSETIYFHIRQAVNEIKITRGTEPLHSNHSARLI